MPGRLFKKTKTTKTVSRQIAIECNRKSDLLNDLLADKMNSFIKVENKCTNTRLPYIHESLIY